MPKELEDLSKDELERLEVQQRVQFAQEVFEDEDRHRRHMNQLVVDQAEATKKTSDLMLVGTQESLRPHRMQMAEVYYCRAEKRYVCRIPFEDPEEETGTSIVAYGDTPAAACDNFDHKWIHGDSNV